MNQPLAGEAVSENVRRLSPKQWARVAGLGLVLLVIVGAAVVCFCFVSASNRKSSGTFDPASCQIQYCVQIIVPASADNCSDVKCALCDVGRDHVVQDSQGRYCALNCSSYQPYCKRAPEVPRTVTSCVAAECEECAPGGDWRLDPVTLEPTHSCAFQCTPELLQGGCALGSCTGPNSCSRCVPGFSLPSNGSLPNDSPKPPCVKASSPQLMTFFMYRAENDVDYPPENTNLGSAGGVMWYLHNQVVNRGCQCPLGPGTCAQLQRPNGITRILRYRVTVMNTAEVYKIRGGQFSHFSTFTSGRCSNPECDRVWDIYGYSVGCQPMSSGNYTGAWYSLPGRCPSLAYNDPQKQDCAGLDQPGGWCDSPDGSATCTWNATLVDFIPLSHFCNNEDYQAFCSSGHSEYDEAKDAGSGCGFWDGRLDPARNRLRVLALERAFAALTPGEHGYSLPDPLCDGF